LWQASATLLNPKTAANTPAMIPVFMVSSVFLFAIT
jgi:hypothetical protein